jgi:hypothetical protein
MLKTVEATIDDQGVVRLSEPVKLNGSRRALVTILDEAVEPDDVTALSEAALAEDWSRPEEDDAWSHLQQRK